MHCTTFSYSRYEKPEFSQRRSLKPTTPFPGASQQPIIAKLNATPNSSGLLAQNPNKKSSTCSSAKSLLTYNQPSSVSIVSGFGIPKHGNVLDLTNTRLGLA
jgi:hypothetical protein